MAIDDKTRAEILRLYYAEKWKIGTIARQLRVHHSTVDRVLAAAGVPRGRDGGGVRSSIPSCPSSARPWRSIPG